MKIALWKKIALAAIILLALTNPTVNDFRDFVNNRTGKRTGYYLLCSTFEKSYTTSERYSTGEFTSSTFESKHTEKYIGVFKNFFLISSE